MAYPLAGTGLILKFCAGFGPDWCLLFCMPLAYVCGGLIPSGGAFGLEDSAAIDNLT